MADLVTDLFNKGIYNKVGDENIPQDAGHDSLGWISTEDSIELSRGRVLNGKEKSYESHQKQVIQNNTIAFGESEVSGKKYKIAQSFQTLAETDTETKQKIHGVILYKKPDTGELSESATVVVSIKATSSEQPSGSALVSKEFTRDEWENIGNGFFLSEFTEYELDRGTTYWIEVSTTNTDTLNHPNLGFTSDNLYTSGLLKTSSNGTDWETESGDLAFHVVESSVSLNGVGSFHIAYNVDGTPVQFTKAGTRIQYFDVNADMYIDVISGLTETKDVSFSDSTSLSGNHVFVSGEDGLWKISVANPESYTDVYDEAKNFKGFALIDKSRMLLWGRGRDKTGFYGSKIDPQDGSVYTTVSGESLGSLGSTTYRGTLAFKAGGPKRTCFGVIVSADYADGTETFEDDFNGSLVGDRGGYGTINYTTGTYEITFANTTTSAPEAEYQWEDSTDGGIVDFTKSTPRTAGEGFIFRQDKGGDAILNVFVQEGKYITVKERGSYEVVLSDDDSSASNTFFRDNIGLPYWRAGVNATNGIIFMNTANPDEPRLTTLQRISTASILEPVTIAEQFDFSLYEWDRCWMETYGSDIVFTGRTKDSSTNNRLFVFSPSQNAMSVLPFNVNSLQKALGTLYAGSSVNQSVSKILNGFDDDGLTIENYWIGRNELYELTGLKRVRRFRVNGKISKEQSIKVSVSYDNEPFEHIGTILGSGDYVDRSISYAIGTAGIGTAGIGGDGSETAYGYYVEIKPTRKPKFRSRRMKFEALGIGYASVDKLIDNDVLEYENKMPSKYRLKQNASLDGEDVNQ